MACIAAAVSADAEPFVEALDQPAVVELQRDRRHGQAGQRLGHDLGDVDVVVERQGVPADDVDVGLQELAVAPLLRPLPAPDLLDLVAAERELELAGVLQHVAGERHGQVEVQGQRVRLRVLGAGADVVVQPAHDVDLLVDLPLAQQLGERLDRARLQWREAGQLEGTAQVVHHLLLGQPLARQPLGEAGKRRGSLGAAHRTSPRSSRYGLVARSSAIVVAAPWPGRTSRSSGSGRTTSSQRASHRHGVAAPVVVSPDAAGEQHVAAEQGRR